jgi:hypothetical protein
MVDSGEYLWECLNYVELNMVRCGAGPSAGSGQVEHPRPWRWSGYEELMGRRNRNRWNGDAGVVSRQSTFVTASVDVGEPIQACVWRLIRA